MNRVETCIPLQTAFEVSYKFALDLENTRYVSIDKEKLDETALNLKTFLKDRGPNKLWGLPKIPQIEDVSTVHEAFKQDRYKWMTDDFLKTYYLVAYELMADSINYCYWYGADNIRPNGANSRKMYKLLDESFAEALDQPDGFLNLQKIIYLFGSKLSSNRFPLQQERLTHLDQLRKRFLGQTFSIELAKELTNKDVTPDLRSWLNKLLEWFPGFAEDIFIKRASLFFMMLNRRMGYFNDDIGYLPIPADYQIPKIMRALGVLRYNDELADKIERSELIPEGSLIECQIRAHTITAAENIARIAECTSTDVDDYLWLERDKFKDKFHLTRTTNY